MARYPLGKTVYEAALDRIRWLYQEFGSVDVSFSGGKDSTVVLELTLIVARELGKLPVNVLFVDQEAEWQCVIDYVRRTFNRKEIRKHWLQCPFKLFNATSQRNEWLQCWEPGEKWLRDKEPDSIHDNIFGTDRFKELFGAWADHSAPDRPHATVTGVREEESPARRNGLTSYATYKHATWGSIIDKKKGHYTFHPIYDWATSDIWHAIESNKWPYCTLYDDMYRYGTPTREMRVSNLHHETAVRTLFHLQEIEPETWKKVTERLHGINTAGQMQQQFLRPTKLPYMFKSWKEYRDHLLENMIDDPDHKESMRKEFAAMDSRYVDEIQDALAKAEIKAILTNDWHGTAMTNFTASHGKWSKNAGVRTRAERTKRDEARLDQASGKPGKVGTPGAG